LTRRRRSIAAQLRAKRTLTGQQIDDCIQRVADEKTIAESHARRAAWRDFTECAAQVTAS
jgi:hypothetical protein